MPGPPDALRQCPSRADFVEGLIAQTILPAMCQERQRRHYHKCWTCAHRNGATQVPIPVPAPVLELPPAARAGARAAAV